MIGACVGYGVVGGAGNVYIGDKAGLANTSGNDNVFIGKCAGCAATASCCMIIGNGTCDLITGAFNTPSLTLDADTFVSNGKGVVIGHTAQITTNVVPEFQMLGTGAGAADVNALFGSWSTTDAASFSLQFLKSGNATIGSFTRVASGESLGGIRWNGDDGTDYASEAATLMVSVDGTPGTGDMPGRMVFSTTAALAEQATEAMRIDSSQTVSVGLEASHAGAHHPLNVGSTGGSNIRLIGRDNGTTDEAIIAFQHYDGSTSHGDITGKDTQLHLTSGGGIRNSADDQGFYTGASGDFYMHHNGTDSWLENVTGILKINTSQTAGISLLYNGSENMVTAAGNGAVTLYYDNAAKLATTSTGVDVSSTGTANFNVVAGAASTPTITFYQGASGRGSIQAGPNGVWLPGGVVIGANSSNNFFDDASIGSGSSTLYIGNASINVTSDVRAKRNILNYSGSALDVLDEARIVEFDYIPEMIADESEYGPSSRGRYVGMLAHEMKGWAPWTVNDGDGDRNGEHLWQAEYNHLVPLTVKALQEAKARIVSLEAQVAALQN